MTAGGLTALLLTLFVELAEPRRRRIELPFQIAVLPEIRAFLQAFAARSGWGKAMTHRLDSASEETLLSLLEQYGSEDRDGEPERRLLLTVHRERDEAVLEFIASTGEGNLQDQIALLGERATEAPAAHEVSLRLLRHAASSVHHQQYPRHRHRDRPRQGPGRAGIVGDGAGAPVPGSRPVARTCPTGRSATNATVRRQARTGSAPAPGQDRPTPPPGIVTGPRTDPAGPPAPAHAGLRRVPRR